MNTPVLLRIFPVFILFMLACSRPAVALDGEVDYTFGGEAKEYGFPVEAGRCRWPAAPESFMFLAVGGDMVTEDSSGRLLLAGKLNEARSKGYMLVRWQPDGRLDTGFGAGGCVKIYAALKTELVSVGCQTDGKIIVALKDAPGLVIRRLLENGNTDLSFGDGGQTVLPVTGLHPPVVKPAPDGGTLVFADQSLRRLLANGREDGDFAERAAGGFEALFDGRLEVAPDGSIVLAGRAGQEWRVYRRNADGSGYAGFSGAAMTFLTDAKLYALKVLPDGNIVAAGVMALDMDHYPALVRWLPDGRPDLSLAADGKFIGGMVDFDAVHGALRPDGRMYLTGTADFGREPVMARFQADGSPDTGFGGAGTINIPPPHGVRGNAVGILPGTGGRLYTLTTNSNATILTRFFDQSGAPPGRLVVEYPPGTERHHGAVVHLGSIPALHPGKIHRLILRNPGAAQLTGVLPAPGSEGNLSVIPVWKNAVPGVVESGGTLELLVAVSPGVTGPVSGSLWVHSADPVRDRFLLNFTAEGTAPAPSISLNRGAVSDGYNGVTEYLQPVAPGDTLTWPLRVMNRGGAPLTLRSISLHPSSSSDFSLVSEGALPVLAAGGLLLNVSVVFRGASAEEQTARLDILSDDPEHEVFTIFVKAKTATALEMWRKAAWGSFGSKEKQASDSGDLDGDGAANLLEYALGTDALKCDRVPAGELRIRDGVMEYTFTRPAAAAADLIYSLEWGPDGVGPWTTAGTLGSVVSAGPVAGTELMKFTAPAGEGRRFVRLKVQARPGLW